MACGGVEDVDFDDWYRAERPKVEAAVAAITGHQSIAPDAADEAFTRAVERWRRVSTMESPGGWVHRTALNVARRRLRREKIERSLLRKVAAGTPNVSAPPAWPLELWEVLRALPPREREAVVLGHVADLSTQAVAEVMGVSSGTVSSTLHSARARMSAAHEQEITDA